MRIGLGTVAAHCYGILVLLTVSIYGYIPAQATNNSELVNVTDSQISLSWSDGTYAVPVSFQLTGSGSVGYSKVSLLQSRSQLSNNSSTSGGDRTLQREQCLCTTIHVPVHCPYFL